MVGTLIMFIRKAVKEGGENSLDSRADTGRELVITKNFWKVTLVTVKTSHSQDHRVGGQCCRSGFFVIMDEVLLLVIGSGKFH